MTDLLFWDERASKISKLLMDSLNCKKYIFWRKSMRQIDENFSVAIILLNFSRQTKARPSNLMFYYIVLSLSYYTRLYSV